MMCVPGETLAGPSTFSYTPLDRPETNGQADASSVPWLLPPLEAIGSNPAGLPAAPAMRFRHSGWRPLRARTWRAFHAAGVPLNRRQNFAYCGFFATVLVKEADPPEYKVAGSCCRDRWCVPCARARSRTIAANLREHLGNRPARFLTLTVKADDLTLRDATDKLVASFQALRRRRLWSDRVTGGAAFLEITRSDKTGDWHPHYHVLVEGKYIPQADLKSAWLEITGDSYIVDIRLVRSQVQVTKYVTKYVSKPLSAADTADQELFVEAIDAMKGRHLCQTFGTWRGLKLTDEPASEGWTELGSLSDFIARAAEGDQEALTILRKIDPDGTEAAIAEYRARPPPKAPARKVGITGQHRLFPLW